MEQAASRIGATVRTASGRVRGLDLGGVHAFLGVPYAAPPVGPRRFTLPVPPVPWEGVRDCNRFGPTAPQPPAVLYPQTLIEGDDCLHLNVYTPEPGGSGLPVLVWIHGGAMVFGSNAEAVDQGARLARRGIVVVSANYRLGVDGFLPLRDAPPNRAVADWVQALEWVHTHVAAFGGDPGQVTLGGYSAGSGASLLLLTARRARRLFRRVVAMSGVSTAFPQPTTAEAKADALARRLGVERTRAGLGSVPLGRLLAAQQEASTLVPVEHLGDPLALFHRVATDREPGWLGPVADDDLVPAAPLEEIAAGAGCDHELLVGCTAQEMDALLGVVGNVLEDEPARRALARIGLGEAAVERWFRAHDGRKPGQVLGAALTALGFRLPVVRAAEARAAARAPTYVYEVAWRPPTPLGAVHGYDLAYAFDNLDADGVALLAAGTPPTALAADLSGALARFVSTGAPGWAPYDAAHRTTMLFDLPSGARPDPARLTRAVFGALR